ncbi:MAG: MATE family efflux transporter [Eubacteriales bacterium]|nr:MATE family efflux transporter [Eubacteriales bacterium]
MENANRMGTTPIPKLIVITSLPLIVSLLVNNLYNLVDSIFVSRISEDALTGLSLAAPIQLIMIAMGSGLAVGLNAVISRALGEKNAAEVRNTASAAMVMAVGAYLLIAAACLVIAEPYFNWQAGGNAAIAAHGKAYIRICMLFSLGQMIQWVFDRFLIATGRSSLFLATLSTASVVNLILDPILIFGYFGLPAMGTAGAATATVIGQFAGGIWGIFLNIKRNKEIPIHFTLHISGASVRKILQVGVPTAVLSGIMSVMGIFINTVLYGFSSTAVAIYGIGQKVQNIAQIAVQGMNNALIPIIAYNYGAGKRERIRQTIRCAFLMGGVVMAVILVVMELIPDQILMLFDASPQMMALGIPAVRLLSLSFFVGAANIIFAAVYQGFGNGNYSMYLVFVRQVAALAPLLLLGAQLGSLNLVWLSFAAAEAIAVPVGILLYKRMGRGFFTAEPHGLPARQACAK